MSTREAAKVVGCSEDTAHRARASVSDATKNMVQVDYKPLAATRLTAHPTSSNLNPLPGNAFASRHREYAARVSQATSTGVVRGCQALVDAGRSWMVEAIVFSTWRLEFFVR